MKIDTKTAWIIGLAGIPLMIYNFNYLFDRMKEGVEESRAERRLEQKTDSILSEVMAGSRIVGGRYQNTYLDVQWDLPHNAVVIDSGDFHASSRRSIDSLDLPVKYASGIRYFYTLGDGKLTHQGAVLEWLSSNEEEARNLFAQSRMQEMNKLDKSEKLHAEWSIDRRETSIGEVVVINSAVEIVTSHMVVYIWECGIIRNGVIVTLSLAGKDRAAIDDAGGRYLRSLHSLTTPSAPV